jgi:hypothetical protein
MPHTATIAGQEFWWTVTLPDAIHLAQGGRTDADPTMVFALDNKNPLPLTISVTLTPEVLFGSEHGFLTIQIDEPDDQEFLGTTAFYQMEGNGLRGQIEIEFHNELGVPLHKPAFGSDGATLAIFVAGNTDNTASTTTFHTPYAHFHTTGVNPNGTAATIQDHFSGVDVRGQVGPLAIGGGGNPSQAPDWLIISGDIAVDAVHTWGPLLLHQRDLSPAADDFTLNFALLDGALTDADRKTVEAVYLADSLFVA